MRERARMLCRSVAAAMLIVPGMALATICPPPAPASIANDPLHGGVIAPVAAELADAGNPLGIPGSVLGQAFDASQSLDQVLLRIRIAACRDVAVVVPAPGVLDPADPAAYKPRTEFDNTPWRFNMSQNGKNMTADEFSAWMKSRGVRVARGAAPAAPAAPAATEATATGATATEAPATEAPATGPSVAEPPATAPIMTAPPAIEPPATVPAATAPAATEPAVEPEAE